MKRLSSWVVSLFLLVLVACQPESESKVRSRRMSEARLSGVRDFVPCAPQDHPPEQALAPDCLRRPPNKNEEPVSSQLPECSKALEAVDEALGWLLFDGGNTQRGIDLLEYAASCVPGNASVQNDLAAGYLVQALDEDRPELVLKAYASASRALEIEPSNIEALFNQALAVEKILPQAARQNWMEYLAVDSDSPWAAEAGSRIQSIAPIEIELPDRWEQEVGRSLRDGDYGALSDLVDQSVTGTIEYSEKTLLAGWAQSSDPVESKQFMAWLRQLATEISSEKGDRYLLDLADHLEGAVKDDDAKQLSALRAAYSAFAEIDMEDIEGWSKLQARLEAEASPLRFRAKIKLSGAAFQVSLSTEEASLASEGGLSSLPDSDDLLSRGYKALAARTMALRSHLLSTQGAHLEAFHEGNRARDAWLDLGDYESLTKTTSNLIGTRRVTGDRLRSLRQAVRLTSRGLQRLRNSSLIISVLEEQVATLRSLGATGLSLELFEQAVDAAMENHRLEVATRGEQSGEAQKAYLRVLHTLLSRAEIELDHELLADAERSIELARREPRPGEVGAEATHVGRWMSASARLLLLRALESEGGQSAQLRRPEAMEMVEEAIQALEFVLGLSDEGIVKWQRAEVYFRLADSRLLLGQREAALEDLRLGLNELQDEEKESLKQRIGADERFNFDAFSSRGRASYALAISLLFDLDREEEAFELAERERSLETVDLLSQRDLLAAVAQGDAHSAREEALALTLSDLNSELDESTALVVFRVLETRLLVWVVANGHFDFFEEEVHSETLASWTKTIEWKVQQGLVEPLKEELGKHYPSVVGRALTSLKDKSASIKRLVFIPDGPLHGLPFSALVDGGGQFLIENFVTSVAPSAKLYLHAKTLDRERSSQALSGACLVADPTPPTGSTLPRLNGARTEVAAIAEAYEDRTVLIDDDATLDGLLSCSREASMLHMATHVKVVPLAPQRSTLFLAPQGEGTGAVEAGELAEKLRFNDMRLVVLSSCSSSGGHPIGSSGLAAMTRPFVAAGASAVMGSLWDISSDLAPDLTRAFHRHFMGGADAALALQKAKLEMIESEDKFQRSPILWAPFQIVGVASAPAEVVN